MSHHYNLNTYLEEVAQGGLGYYKTWEEQINNVTVYTTCGSSGLITVYFKY